MTTNPMVNPIQATGRFFLFAAVVGALCVPADAQGRIDPEKLRRIDAGDPIKAHKKYMARLAFMYHTKGRMILARAREPETLDVMIKDYRRPKSESEYTRYTLAFMFGKYYDGWMYADHFKKLRADHQGLGDIWMWVNTVANDDGDDGAAEALQVARESKNLFLKAAAIEAMALRDRPEVLEVIPKICAEFPGRKKPGERRLLLGALSSAILANKDSLRDEAMQKAIRAYIGLLAKEVKLDLSAKMVIARFLAKTIGKDRRYIDPEPWIRLLDQDFTPPKRAGNTVTTLRFFGVEAEGDRICYLVDMSNSMLKTIDPALLKQKRGPMTGKKKRRKKKGQLPDENDIPWHLVKTRFDLAREHLKISIQRLTKDKRFCVVWFGDNSGLFKTTPGMIKATRTNVKKVIKELDSIRKQSPPKGTNPIDAPDGWLRGQTNMHGGLRKAFALHAKGFALKNGYVDLKPMATGCDTIFLLSDGAPSSDDFRIKDRDYFDVNVVHELEQKRAAPRPQTITYHGPMDQKHWMVNEVRRFNAFRKVQVHCIGVGDADIDLLRKIAKATDGEVFLFGAIAKAAGKAAGKRR